MTEIIERIKTYAIDIYYLSQQRLTDDYVDICTEFSKQVDRECGGDTEVVTLKNELLNHLLKVMRTGDFTRMANALEYEVVPVAREIKVFSRKC